VIAVGIWVNLRRADRAHNPDRHVYSEVLLPIERQNPICPIAESIGQISD
jgi:hypothetical protein